MDRRTSWIIFSVVLIFNYETYAFRSCLNNSTNDQSLLIRIYKALSYMKQNIADLNVDAYFGISLAYAQLSKIKTRNDLLNDVRYITHDLINMYENSRNENIGDLERHLVNDKIWENIVIDANYTPTCYKRFNKPIFKSHVTRLLLNSVSTPNELQSDMCLTELMDAYEKRDCKTSMECRRIVSQGRSIGYSTTHRLLFWLFYRALDFCERKSDVLKRRADELYCDVLEQRSMIEDAGYPVLLRDLFMEQAVVCRMSGYGGLLNPTTVRLTMDWQGSIGCWGDVGRLRKRSTTSLGLDSCSSHETSVGISLLAFALHDCYSRK